jgi:hypothetical protein
MYFFFLLFIANPLWAESKNSNSSPATKDVADPLKVRGQTRSLSNLFVSKSTEDKIKFIKIRKDYREEIIKTPY